MTVDGDNDGQRLDRWLRKKRPDLPYVLIQKLLRKGQVRVNGKRAKPDMRLSTGQQVRMPLGGTDENEAPRAKRAPAKDSAWLKQFVIYEDDELLVFNKPPGLAVQGGSGLDLHMEMMMDGFKRHDVAPRLVHRLDRETSGVLVMARSASAARKMGEQFAERDTEKTYWALVLPGPKDESGMIDAPLAKVGVGTDLEKMKVAAGGQEAQTEYRVIARADNGVTWMEFKPYTGRTHQIRVHAAHIGCPLLGDPKYGGDNEILKKIKGKTRVHLHAASLRFMHPKTGEAMEMIAPLPDDLGISWRAFGFPVS